MVEMQKDWRAVAERSISVFLLWHHSGLLEDERIMTKFQVDGEQWFWTSEVVDLDLPIIFLVNVQIKSQGISCYLYQQVNNIGVVISACEEIDNIGY